MLRPTQIQWAQLAAYIDSEGCIHISMKSRSEGRWDWRAFDLLITVANTDPRLPQWCAQYFGGTQKLAYPKNYKNKNYKACFRWQVYGKACGEILRGILPYSIIKREQIEIGLAYVETLQKTYHRHTMPEEIKAERAALFLAMKKAREIDSSAAEKNLTVQ
jgi:hypothetical protein